MIHYLKGILILLLFGLVGPPSGGEEGFPGRFVPRSGATLVFVSGDPAAIGGTERYRDGFVNNVDVPAGVSQTMTLGVPAVTETTFPLRTFLDSMLLDRCVIHLDLEFPSQDESELDLASLLSLIKAEPGHPFAIQMSFRPDDDPEVFRRKFRSIVKAFADEKAANVTFVLGSRGNAGLGEMDRFDPGRELYSWTGGRWDGSGTMEGILEFTRRTGKRCFVELILPKEKVELDLLWDQHLRPFFEMVEKNQSLIGAISYPARESEILTASDTLLKNWRDRMNLPQFINSADKPFDHIGFPAPLGEAVPSVFSRSEKYRDSSLPTEERLEDLLYRMSPEQKLAQLRGWRIKENSDDFRKGRIFDKELYAEQLSSGIGLMGSSYLNREDDIRQHLVVQDYLLRETNPSIPAIFFNRASHGIMKRDATTFPVPLALSCSWNPDLVEKIYDHVGREARSRGVSLVLGPTLNLTRDPRWGGTDETLGEDPFLAARLGAAMVRGLQGRGGGTEFIPRTHVAAAPFHFAGSGAGMGGKSRAAVDFGARRLLDNEIEVFRQVNAESHPAGVVLAYNEIDGIPCHLNEWLIQEVLRKELQFKGLVISEEDWLSFALEEQKTGKDAAAVAEMAAKAGLEMDLSHGAGAEAMKALAEQNRLPAATLDEAVRSVLDLKFKLGLFENSPPNASLATELVQGKAARNLAQEAARQSLVLLKNQGLLPLDRSRIKKLAVIGPNADVCRTGSASGTPEAPVSLLDGIRRIAGPELEIVHAVGSIFALNDTHNSYQNWQHVSHVNFADLEMNEPLIEQAAVLAAECDVVVLALGENMLIGRESRSRVHIGDRSTLALTPEQELLAKKVLATGRPVILYLAHGRPIALGDLEPRFQAILTGHYNGQETGTAAAEVIFGDYHPSGKLTVTWPKSSALLPSRYGTNHGSGIFAYVDQDDPQLYPFGHGLSYTTFDYSAPVLSSDTLDGGESVAVTFQVGNTGQRKGTEIAQLYVSGQGFPVVRPDLALKGFARIELEPGEIKEVQIEIKADDLAFHDARMRRVLMDGEYQVRVGGSSQALGPPVKLSTRGERPPEKEEKPGLEPKGVPKPGATEMSKVSPSVPQEKIAPPPLFVKAETRPNVLFIGLDDLRPGFEAFSPNIEKLAHQGLRFENAYCQQATSWASRLSLMTGKYPASLEVASGDFGHWRKLLAGVMTLNQCFDGAGYETIGLGKLYGDSPEDNARGDWDRWTEVAAVTTDAEVREQADETFLDWKRAGEAARALEELSASQKAPFFVGLGFSLPRMGQDIPLRYWDRKSEEEVLPLPKFAEVNSHGERAELIRTYSAAVSYIDDCVGRVLNTLDATGLAQNTLVVLWSDRGINLGDHDSRHDATLFECDHRVSLIVFDPRHGLSHGKRVRSLVELVDLYPTLCDLAGIQPPEGLQGRSFKALLENPSLSHREIAYSYFPSFGQQHAGHSIRFQRFRYTEWFDADGKLTQRILTDLEEDPGEKVNLAMNEARVADLKIGRDLLYHRIFEVSGVELKEPESEPGELAPVDLIVDISPQNLRQTIEGFGGSIIADAVRADDEALDAALAGLNTSILRVQGEISPDGDIEHSRDVLQRAMRMNPKLRIILTFWQPKSVKALDPDYWMRERGRGENVLYELRPEREEEWANEILFRVKQFVNWGANVTAVSVQNQPNRSSRDQPSCQWEPERLAHFIENKLRPRFLAAGLHGVQIAAPDLSSPGEKGEEIDRFIPVLTSPAVHLATFQMHEVDPTFRNAGDKLVRLVKESHILAALRSQHFPEKQLWMTETEGLSESTAGDAHDRAMEMAHCIHIALVNGEASAFLWKHLLQAPGKGGESGLILLENDEKSDLQKIRSRSQSFFAFRQYSGFIDPGSRRIEIAAPGHIRASAFLSPGSNMAVAVVINDNAASVKLSLAPPEGMKLIGSFQTDEKKRCSPAENFRLAPKSIRTFIFSR